MDCPEHAPPRMNRPLNVLQVCDHLGWEGSRMHGVKRLFGWMIPRFDRDRFRVSLVSLRKKDLSEETLDALGRRHHVPRAIEVRSAHACRRCSASSTPSRSTSCTCTATARRRSAGLSGRCGGFRPSCTSTPTSPTRRGIRKSPTGASSRRPTSRWPSRKARRTSWSVRGRFPAAKVKVVYLGVPLEEFSRERTADEVAERAGASLASPSRRLRDRHA